VKPRQQDRWNLKLLRGVIPLIAVRLSIRRSMKMRNLYYQTLTQLSFWCVLGFTGDAWCNSIPKSQAKTIRPSVEAKAPLPNLSKVQTGSLQVQFPEQVSDRRERSHHAKDLNLTDSSLRLRDLHDHSQHSQTAFAPPRVVVQDAGTSTQFTPISPIQHSSSVDKGCWQAPIATCSYSRSKIQINQAESFEPSDPELGNLRVSPIEEATENTQNNETAENNQDNQDTELGTIRAEEVTPEPVSGAVDPDLGIIRLQEPSIPQAPPDVAELPVAPRQPSLFLIPRIDYFQTTNVFSNLDPRRDGLIRTGISLFYTPTLGPKTFLVSAIDANLLRYSNFGRLSSNNSNNIVRSLNYDELSLRVGLYQRLSPRMSGEIGWTNQKLFRSDIGLRQIFGGERFLNDNSIRLELSRQDPLLPRLALNTFYQLRWSLVDSGDLKQFAATDPESAKNRSRLLNSFIGTLSYAINPRLQAALDYQFTWSHFTQQDRDDLYHQLVGRLTYNFTPRNQVTVFTGFSFGSSTNERIDFNSFIFGVGLSFNLPLF
jgi:hypothetical protein